MRLSERETKNQMILRQSKEIWFYQFFIRSKVWSFFIKMQGEEYHTIKQVHDTFRQCCWYSTTIRVYSLTQVQIERWSTRTDRHFFRNDASNDVSCLYSFQSWTSFVTNYNFISFSVPILSFEMMLHLRLWMLQKIIWVLVEQLVLYSLWAKWNMRISVKIDWDLQMLLMYFFDSFFFISLLRNEKQNFNLYPSSRVWRPC